jgi:hypothetical protein
MFYAHWGFTEDLNSYALFLQVLQVSLNGAQVEEHNGQLCMVVVAANDRTQDNLDRG